MRLAHTQVWPEPRNLDAMAPATAASRSASSKTMNGALLPNRQRFLPIQRRRTHPPSSMLSFLSDPLDCSIKILPTRVEPVI